MRYILYGNIWKRLGARLIDFILSLALTCALFFPLVYPATFDSEKYINNLEEMGQLYDESGLYIKSSKGNFTSIGAFTAINTVEELTKMDLYSDDEKFSDVNLTKQLYDFYLNKFTFFGAEYNLTDETFKSQVMQVGSEISNIKDLIIDGDNFTYVLIDDNLELTTVNYVKDQFLNAADFVTTSKKVSTLNNENQQLMYSSLWYIIPLFVDFSLIFDLLIPLFSKEGKSIGKYIFKLGILTKDGYQIKKYKLIFRWLGYLIIEIFLGILTFCGTMLISYTMMLFNKRKRVIHDYIAGTMVVDTKTLIYFRSAEEERRFLERVGNKTYE